ncbi:PaaI family thioesterase [Novosphingobium sp. 9]|uniref:PaaI family thioesterase n=1 Tax=Novosphingobium sp. 9 TaxID=2025349 RepID=UPI0021B6A45D|nr:PaaI family thioesterase [Novosphingobium sp. 9]
MLQLRHDSHEQIRLRIPATAPHLGNSHGNIHGGAILTLIDMGIFAAARSLLEERAEGAVTLDLHNQFVGTGRLGEPLDVVSEVVRETGRLIFLRGSVEQGEHLVSSFLATLRKSPRP